LLGDTIISATKTTEEDHPEVARRNMRDQDQTYFTRYINHLPLIAGVIVCLIGI
jgi:hypothetical protein